MIAGLDEAGRGPVIGPMVVCGVLLKENDLERLKLAGVKDSKLLTPRKREALADFIKTVVKKHILIHISPKEIDDAENLNELEAMKFAQIINSLNPSLAFVDSTDPNPSLFKERLLRYLKLKPRLVIENSADRKYVQVAAASILAKVERDAEIEKLRREYGDFGSGYPADPKTRDFLSRWIKEKGEFPPFVRKSWKTIKKLENSP
ncbi:MAG: ribonuclease HII [Candidatus Hadarchaeales archaeon]